MKLEKTVLGIELGSTRIKAVLIDEKHRILAKGGFNWESSYRNGYWTYSLEEVWNGLQQAFAALRADCEQTYHTPLTAVGAIGISAMMHGFLPFDRDGKLLTPFRTWRNVTTGQAASELSALFACNIPQRWSIAHLDQAVLNGEFYLPELDYMTTLAGYVHWMLTGERVLGVGDASGMFPIDPETCDYDAKFVEAYNERIAPKGYPWDLRSILPKVLPAGVSGGSLTEAGAHLLDPTGVLQAGIRMAPPEGDAGTGMAATNSVRPRTGNVSAGTSIFSMVVLEHPLKRSYPEIDIVTTPDGHPTAMVHCNNGTSDLNAWMQLFAQVLEQFGAGVSAEELYSGLFLKSLEGSADCGGTLVFNMTAGEPVIGLESGVPLVFHSPENAFRLPDFMRAQIYACFAALRMGMRLLDDEQVACDRFTGHGGLFRTPGVAQRYLAAALNTPVETLPAAEEGGAFGMALLAAYMCFRKDGQTLDAYLDETVFAGQKGLSVLPEAELAAGYESYLKNYASFLPAVRQMNAAIMSKEFAI